MMGYEISMIWSSFSIADADGVDVDESKMRLAVCGLILAVPDNRWTPYESRNGIMKYYAKQTQVRGEIDILSSHIKED